MTLLPKPCFTRLAVVHHGALGDFLLAANVLAGIFRANPSIQMDFCARRDYVELISTQPFVRSAEPLDDAALAPFYHDHLWVRAPLPESFLKAHAVLVFGQAGSQTLVKRLSQRLSCAVHFVRSFPPPADRLHVHDFLLTQLRSLGWPVIEGETRITPRTEEQGAAAAWLEQQRLSREQEFLLIHPGSGGLRKVWPLQHWWNLLRFLRHHWHGVIVLTLGPADERLRELAREAGTIGVTVLEPSSPSRLAALLEKSRLYAGSDSGVSHLAALVGTPAVVFFGPTDPEVWGPRGNHVTILQSRWEEGEVLRWSPGPLVEPIGANLHAVLKRLIKLRSERG